MIGKASEYKELRRKTKMNKRINTTIVRGLALIAFFSILLIEIRAEALDPKLLWKKEFKQEIESVDLATESGDVILSLGKREIIIYDRTGNKRFHWGPRIDRMAGGVGISKDGKYFVFYSGYKEIYADKKKVPRWSDDRIHFYNRQTKKEIWNIRSPESVPLISSDGSSIVIFHWSGGGFEMLNFEGKKIFEYRQNIWDLALSPDGNYLVATGDFAGKPLMLFKKDGTKLWEKGRHKRIASISEGASYISTYPYSLGLSYTADPQNTHKGIIYDRGGNIIMVGFGILSGDGSKVSAYAPDKVYIISLPNKITIKEIPIQVYLPDVDNPFFAAFSYNGRYLVLRNGDFILVFDLIEDKKWETNIMGLGTFPTIKLSKDGRYLLVFPEGNGSKKIYYYQLY